MLNQLRTHESQLCHDDRVRTAFGPSCPMLVAQACRVVDIGSMEELARRIRAREKELREAQQDLAALRADNRPVPAERLTRADIEPLLADLHKLLDAAPAEAAPVLRSLTGPIQVSQKSIPGLKKPSWVLTFSPDLMAAIKVIQGRSEYPFTGVLEYLCTGKWIVCTEVTAVVH